MASFGTFLIIIGIMIITIITGLSIYIGIEYKMKDSIEIFSDCPILLICLIAGVCMIGKGKVMNDEIKSWENRTEISYDIVEYVAKVGEYDRDNTKFYLEVELQKNNGSMFDAIKELNVGLSDEAIDKLILKYKK